ncbi:uncharacterized protein LOC125319131 isoform X7 [Corvus hawaiiensis]|uniref:uncharacterized protein LOC125319131 isoform X7 n=1 Tax=Corvus hawaiiensis TaxID=134902 RepID=UPI002019DAF2|nr:uncharacterized protein LOC125319131 isoform X7 [Corvus hawaiiensis]
MNLPILTAVLLGLVLTPALADYSQQINQNQQIIFGGESQITITGISQGVQINSQTRVAIIEQKSKNLSWKTVWNYNTGIIATKLTQQNTCYISAMNRNEMPSFDNLARLAAESRNLIGFGRTTKHITFVTNGLVNNLNSYGATIAAMCSGLTTYMAYEVHAFQGPQVNLGSCITLNVLRVVELKYCNGNGNGNWNGGWNDNWTGGWNGNWTGPFPSQQIPGIPGNNTQVIIGGQSQIVIINRQWRVAVIEQNSISGSWKTIWNYNTGVIATKVTQQNACYISVMNRNEMPRFDNLARLAQESRNLIGFGRTTKHITFVTNGLVNNLNSYGATIAAMCSGLTTYMAYEVHAFQGPQVNLGSCITLNVLRVVELKYCNGNGNGNWNGGWNDNWTGGWQGNWTGGWNGNWTGPFPSQQIPGIPGNNTQVIIGGQSQIVIINRQWRVAVIEQNSISGSWKTIWNYNTGVIATKVTQQNACYISVMNRNEMPRFDNLARLAQESRNLIGFGRTTKHITFVTNGLVNNLNSYGATIAAMCSGLTTYMAYEVHAFQGPQVNLGSCITLNVLRVVELKYCNGNGNGNWNGGWNDNWTGGWQGNWTGGWNGNWTGPFPSQQIPGIPGNNTQVIIGGQSQIVIINRQWRVAVIEQNSISGSWKTIWNYNTGVIATKVTQQNACYISVMNRNEMPRFDNLARLAQESRNLIGFGRTTKHITFVTNGLVNNLNSYGATIAAMCSGLTTYMAYEVHAFQGPQVNLGSCITLNVLRVVELKYCNGNGNGNWNGGWNDNWTGGWQGNWTGGWNGNWTGPFPSQQIPGIPGNNTQVIIGGQSQIVIINRQWRVAVIEQNSISGSWKTIWNYNTGVIATKVTQQNACYISVMNRNEMPRFDNLARLAQESRNLIGFGRTTKHITFVTNGLVNNLNSYGATIAAMCSGLTTYMAYEVHAFQGPQVNLGSCITLNVLRVVELKYCNGNGNGNWNGGWNDNWTGGWQGNWTGGWNGNWTGPFPSQQIPGIPGNNTQVIIGGQSQIVIINRQWRVAVIEQNSISGSWKTIWNYNTGVIATKVTQQNACYISVMNRNEMPRFDNLARLAQESRNLIGFGRTTKHITFVTNGLVNNLNSYGATIAAMCSGLTTYMAYEVHAFQGPQVNLGSCITLNVLRVVELKYCNGNGNGNWNGGWNDNWTGGWQGNWTGGWNGNWTGPFPSQQIPGIPGNNTQVIIGGQSQIVIINRQWRVAVIEQNSISGSWKTIWNYNTGVIATKVTQQNACYISVMNRNEMPRFDNLARLAQESRNLIGFGRTTKHITFVTNGLVNNLNSYGATIAAMCSGLTTYMAYEVHAFQGPQVNLGSCITLNVLRVVELKYCNGNGNGNWNGGWNDNWTGGWQGNWTGGWNGNWTGPFPSQQIPGIPGNNTQVIIGGQSQIVIINRQWRVAVIEQNSISGSWKTIWNYNTGVIATKVTQQNACYISVMNRNEMPRFDNLARLAQESRNLIGFGRTTKHITFVTNGLVNNLNSYGATIAAMCSGLTTYMAYEVHAFQGPQVNLGSCITLNVLRVVELKYCNGNGNGNWNGGWNDNWTGGWQGNWTGGWNGNWTGPFPSQQIPGIPGNNTQVIIGGQSQIVIINRQWRVAVIEQNSISGSWKTIWNYNTGVIATKVTQQNACYISVMNRNEMPRFDNLARLAQESRNLIGFGRTTKHITFVTNGLVNNLNSYGATIAAMCSGLTTYMAYEVHAFQGPQVNLGSCITLNVLRVVELKYCNGNGNGNWNGGWNDNWTGGWQGNWTGGWNGNWTGPFPSQQIPGIPGNNTQVIIGGQSQIVIINRQWRVAVIEQNSISGSWKTIWNYNTGVIATKVTQQNACYISVMNRNEMPRFDNLARLAQESRNLIGFGRTTKHITFVTNGLVNNLNSYGATIAAMCSGLTTYMAYEVHAFQGPQVNLGSCITLNVLRVVELKYCNGNGNGNWNGGWNDNWTGGWQGNWTGGWNGNWTGPFPSQQIPGIPGNNTQVIIGGQSQIVIINRQWRVAVIEQNSISGSWKTIWNYNTGVIATKVTQQNACYISVMNRNEMPRFDNLARLAQESRNLIGFGRTTKHITFVTNGLVNNLNSYGATIAAMCSGLTTYMAYEVHAFQGPQVNLGSCITLNVLRVVELKYCNGNGNGNWNGGWNDNWTGGWQGNWTGGWNGNWTGPFPSQQIPGIPGNNTQVIIGGQSQIVIINRQWRVAVIEQNSISGSWKTIWNYNTGVIATKVTQQNACYISVMNRNEMPRFDNLARLAQESRNLIGFGRTTKHITFVTNGLVNNLNSYGATIAAMCSGLTTYMAYEVHAFQGPQVNLGSCITLNVLRVVELKYCNGNGNGNWNGGWNDNWTGGWQGNWTGGWNGNWTGPFPSQQIPGIPGNNTQVIIGGQSQIVIINRQWRVAVIEQNSISGSWKTIWNYNTGVIATKVTQQNACYISVMNRNEMPRFDNLARLAQESRNLIGFGRTTKHITFVTNGLVNNLNSYGATIAAMCSGLTTYMAYEVHAFQGPQVNLGSCITLNVLRVVELKYCNGNGNGNWNGGWNDNWTGGWQGNWTGGWNGNWTGPFPSQQIPGIPGNNTQVIIGGQSQIVIINRQWHVAVIEQNSISGSWKTIWNYNTGVIATKVTQQNACYISVMNRNEMPRFDNLARLAQESRNLIGFGRTIKHITFVTNGLVNNLNSYGATIAAMCSGLTTYMAYEVHAFQGPQVNLGSCITLNVLRVVELKYCNGNGNGNWNGGWNDNWTGGWQGNWTGGWNGNWTGPFPSQQIPGIPGNNTQVIIGGQSQIVIINRQWRVAVIEQNSISGSWKTIWNYNTGVIATKVTQQNACYISVMNRNEMPRFDNLARLAQESRNLIGFGRTTKHITFVTNGLVNNLNSYGATIAAMCSGLTTYMAYEVHAFQGPQVNLGSCITLNVLRVVELKYCNGNGNGNWNGGWNDNWTGGWQGNWTGGWNGNWTGPFPSQQIPGIPGNNTQVIIGGQSQIVIINRQWRVAVIEQNSISGSWKTIWNYNTGVIATKVTQQNACYISVMNRNEMPRFDNLARLAQESRNLIGFGRTTKHITFVTNGLVNNLNSYGATIAAMCSGLTTYMAYEVHAFQGPQVNLGSCITLNVLRVVELKYCNGNGNGNWNGGWNDNWTGGWQGNWTGGWNGNWTGPFPSQQIPGIPGNNTQVIIGGQSQIVIINRQWRVAVIEQNSISGSWKTIWNYNTGVIATKVTQQNACYISVMNRNEMPRFDNLARLAQESRNLIGFGRTTKHITFVTNGLVNNLNSYGATIAAMCSGLTTYMAYEVHAFQGPQVNLGSCITLNVLRVVELKYCNGNGNGNWNGGWNDNWTGGWQGNWTGGWNGNWTGPFPSQQIPGIPGNNTQVIIGGQSQIVIINRQWRVAVIEQNSISGSWKTIWNYNTGVIATKVTQQNACYISVMNRNEMPRFDNLARLAQESRNLIGFGRTIKHITFVTNGLVNNLNSYGATIAAMCSGLTTYMAYEVHAFQGPQVNLGSCITLNVLRVVELKYCNGNGNGNWNGGWNDNWTGGWQGNWTGGWNGNWTGPFPSQQIPGIPGNNTQVIIGGQSQIVIINRQWRVAVIEQNSISGSWKTIWNYNTGVIATKVTQQNACYISVMNRNEMPRFDNLARLAQESRNLIGFGRTTKHITFVTNGLVNNLNSYGATIAAMCSGLTTYMAYEVHAFQGPQVNLGSCITLNVLRVVELKYCNGNGNGNWNGGWNDNWTGGWQGNWTGGWNGNWTGPFPSQQIPGIPGNNTQVIIGGQSQIVIINRQWHVAVIEQNSISGSWKTIWNYNTGVIATKVTQQNACYISVMNRNEMPRFDNLARLAQESRNLIGFGRTIKHITFVTNGLVNNLNSYGATIAAMCSGLTTYMAYEVHAFQGPQVNLGSCITLNVLRVVELKYCNGNGNGNWNGGWNDNWTGGWQGNWTGGWNGNWTGPFPSQQIPGIPGNNTQVIIGGQSQIVIINRQWRVAVIEQNSISGSWKTIWNYNTGVIATKVTQQNACYISVMNRNEMPRFDNLARLAQESRNLIGFGRTTKHITFVTNGLVNNLNSYGATIAAMCSGLTTYMAYEVHAFQGPQVNLGSCITLNVLRVVELKYCNGNGNGNWNGGWNDNWTGGWQGNWTGGWNGNWTGPFPSQQIPGIPGNNTQVIIGGQSQIVIINRQWRVAVIEQNSISGSWKTIWNYNTGVIATKVTQQNACYISVMNRNEMPRFDNLARLAQESRNLIGFGRTTKHITFVTNGLVNNLNSYGATIAAMCSGLTTYMAYEVHAFQGPQVNLGSCITLNVLRVVELKYCNGNGNGNWNGGWNDNWTGGWQGNWTGGWNGNWTGPFPSQQIPGIPGNNTQVIIGGQSQIVIINRQWRVAVIEQNSISGSWKTIWNYNTGVIATKVTQQNACYISVMNRNEMPRFDNLARLAQESRNLIGFGRTTKHITFVTNGLVNNLNSYGATIAAMCSGLTTYMAYEVHAFQGPQVNLGSCITLNVLRVVELKYCNGNGNGNWNGGWNDNWTGGWQGNWTGGWNGNWTGPFPSQQIPGIPGNNTQVIIGGQSQIVIINRQWRVAVIEQNSISGSWKTIWNYNTGVIATKVTQQNACYISVMNRNEMPRFDNLARLAQESRNLIGFGRTIKHITFVTNGLVNNLNSYGATIAAMCSGLTTYMAYEVHAFQGPQVNLGSCITLNVLRVVELKYCNGNGNGNWNGGWNDNWTGGWQGNWTGGWNGNWTGPFPSQQIPGIPGNNTQVIIGGQSQIVIINRQWRVAVIEQNSISGSWKTIWNYNTGVIATKVTQQNACYISVMNRNEMPRFDNLARLAQESRNLIGFGRTTKHITFVTNGLVNNLNSYGATIAAMCSGLTTYMAYEVHAFQGPQVNLGSCITLNVLRVVELKYCNGNGNGNWNGGWNDNWTGGWQGNWTGGWNGNWTGPFPSQQIPGIPGNNTQVIIGGQSQIVIINRQWRVAVIEQNSISGSWKTIWNYNTGVIATKVTQQNACYISVMNRNEMPRFDNLARLAQESRNLIGFGRTTKHITFVTNGLVNNLNSYGATIAAMCSGLTTYMAYEVHAFQGPQVNLGSCITLNVLRVVELKYCNGNGNGNWNGGWNDNWTGGWQGNWTGGWQGSWSGGWNGNWTGPFPQTNNNQQIITGGDSQISISGGNSHISISGVSQSMNINSQTQEAIFEQKSNHLSWKTIWNYNTDVIATKVMQERTCYISIMNRSEMPTFAAVVKVAAEKRNLIGFGRPTKQISFVTNGLVNNLNSYGATIAAMCSGLTTYMAYEVHAFQGPQVNLGSCITLHVLSVVDLKYCNGNGQSQQIPGIPGNIPGNTTQVIIGGQSQIVTINRQWHVAIIEQNSISGSWKTIWNYNTGVIATKVTQQNTCYISIMNRSEMPSFNNLARLAQESRNQIGFGRPTKHITFVANGLVNNLRSYGADVFSMCSGLTTYMAYEVHAFQGPQVNLGSCITLHVLSVVDLKYCNGNGQSQQIPGIPGNNTQVIIGGQSQIVTINRQWHVAIIEQNSISGSWKTIWNYNTGVIATKVTQQNTCYISIMNRSEMPSFNNLARLAQESRNQIGFGRPTKHITFVANGLVNNLRSYGADVFSMCSGLTTYMAYEVHAFQGPQVNLGSCITLHVLSVVDLKYCNGNGQSQQIPGIPGNNTQVIIGGQSQIVTINRQWHVAIIEQNSISGSWKTIWNYNTGVIATKVTQQNTCYISIMNRSEMPSFNNLARLAQESRNQIGFGRPTKHITFVANGLVNNLRSYGADVFSMCSGLTTYMAYEVHAFQGPQVNLGSCITLHVLSVVDLKYCNGNGQSQQTDNNCHVSGGGLFQNLTLSSQTRVVVIEQRSEQFSWKTIWNYNTGIIATKVVQERTCYISTMNKNEMPSFDALVRLASENRNQIGFGRPTKHITFVANGLVNNLRSYGADVFSMCSGLPTYMAYEVHRPQLNQGSCVSLDVLKLVDLNYCGGSIKA